LNNFGVSFLTDLDHKLLEERVGWNLEVQRCWALSNSAGGIVVGTVAWAEVASGAHTDIGYWNATEMRANTEADQVLLVLTSLGIGLLISKSGDINGVHIINLRLSSVSHEERLASPFHGNTAALWHCAQLDLGTSHSHNILGSCHVSDVLVAVTGYTGADGGTDGHWVHVAEGGLARSDFVLIGDVFGAAARLSVSRVHVVKRLDVIAGVSQAELDGLSSHVQQILMTNPL